MTIKDLSRWESLEMVQRYTRSVTFEDSMKHYKEHRCPKPCSQNPRYGFIRSRP
jgi:heme-degrading monooxygenase HmoA